MMMASTPRACYLEEIARELSDDVWVVAPESEQSGAGHSLTLTEPLRLRQIDDKRFAVRGTPTDSVMLAVNHIMKDQRPTLLLSGINRGANLAEDVTYSGTVAGRNSGWHPVDCSQSGDQAFSRTHQLECGAQPWP